jgi:hypothetical protein
MLQAEFVSPKWGTDSTSRKRLSNPPGPEEVVLWVASLVHLRRHAKMLSTDLQRVHTGHDKRFQCILR